MDGDYKKLERLCDEHLAAAETSNSAQARIAHLEQAFRYAQQAVRAHGHPRVVSIDSRPELVR